MTDVVPYAVPAAVVVHVERAAAVPRLLRVVLYGATGIILGLIWDISWHQSIGRDTFWSPPHMLIYLGAIFAGLASALEVLVTSFAGTPQQRSAAVSVLGFRGPLGAFYCCWGAGAMLTSAPFDDWWHNTYGLDVKILSPPHVVLALGILSIALGAMLLAVAEQNRQPGDTRLPALHAWAAGLLLTNVAVLVYEYSGRVLMHHAIFYQVVCLAFPLVLVAAARASRLRWPATAAAGVYMAIFAAQLWLLPLFPAEPKLGPVRQAITHMIPLKFPLLVILPALALDLLLRRGRARGAWLQAVALGAAFLAVFLPVQWLFGTFLMSEAARNAVFGARYFPYFLASDSLPVRGEFVTQPVGALAQGLGVALLVAMLGSRLGLAWGEWMTRVRR